MKYPQDRSTPARSLARPRAWLRHAALSLVLAAATAGGPAAAGPAPWPDAPYSYFANNVPLETVLAEFASSFTLTLSMQPGVTGQVNGRFTTRNPSEFIARLGGVYGFSWFTHAGTLHVSKASDIVTRSIPMPASSQGQLHQAMLDLGVLEPRFGWGELPDQGVVLVSGPPDYVRLLESTLRQLPPGASAQQVMVFRLRHASADDRVIQYRDRQITQPGLATVLRDLIANRFTQSAASAPSSASAGDSAPSVATGDAAVSGVGPSVGAGAPVMAGAASPRVGGGAGGRIGAGLPGLGGRRSSEPQAVNRGSIQSDPRLNALVIQDVPERMPLYQQLIAQLDVPTALIEIEAMIIDINSDKAKELGINWTARAGSTAFGFGRLSSDPGPGTLSIVNGRGNINASTLVVDAGNYLISQIRLLESDGSARIQSRPSVLTTDNTGALLDLSETFYIRIQGERVASVSPVTAGTTLRVTPRLIDGPERSIQLAIDIEDGQIQDRQVDSLPTVRRSTVSTQAIVRQDETLLIAGHSSDQSIDSNQRVPFLGDIPVVGLLFSNKSKLTQKRERLFMIRPKLVSVPPPMTVGAAP